MPRVIDIDKLKQHMGLNPEDWYTPDERWLPERDIAYYIDTCPQADIVGVVRCKDCKDFDEEDLMKGKSRGFCNIHGGYMFPDHFCARGERRKK